jgi:NitT/TauT family transport system permease protein
MLPTLWDNMRITLGWCWSYVIVAEIVAADSGLGFVIMQARRYFKTPEVMAGVIAIGIIGLVTDQILRALHKRLFPYMAR